MVLFVDVSLEKCSKMYQDQRIWGFAGMQTVTYFQWAWLGFLNVNIINLHRYSSDIRSAHVS